MRTDLKVGDKIRVQLNPQKIELYKIFRHPGYKRMVIESIALDIPTGKYTIMARDSETETLEEVDIKDIL